MDLKESIANFFPPLAPRRAPPKIMEQANPPLPPSTDAPVSSSDATDIGNNQEGEDIYAWEFYCLFIVY